MKINKKKCLILLVIGLALLIPTIQIDTVRTASGTTTSLVACQSSSFLLQQERIDYRNSEGDLAFAEDKHYASVVYTKDDRNRVILEEFFDENGKPVRMPGGYCVIAREYDAKDNNTVVNYLDENGDKVMLDSGYASLHRSYYPDGKLETEMFYDDEENIVVLSQGQSGSRYSEYDKDRRSHKTEYLDDKGKNIYITAGYTAFRQTFYDDGKVKEKIYLDEDNEPTDGSFGEYGILYEDYNTFGDACKLTYLDKEGKPTLCNYGYATVVRTFADDRSLLTERYYDLSGNPVDVGKGRYGVIYSGEYVTSLDINGKPIFRIEEMLHQHFQVVVLFVVIFLLLLARMHNPWEHRGALIFSLIIIIYMTLLSRENGNQQPQLDFFWSYRQIFSSEFLRNEILNNILLFIPFGAALKKVWPKKRALLLVIICTVVIELIQYFGGYGLCEIDDVISNSIGGVLGYLITAGEAQEAKR